MARLPLLHMRSARAGERGKARAALDELAYRLRHDPTPAECEEAARILARLSNGGRAGWSAAGLNPARRPHGSGRIAPVDLYHAVETLRLDGLPVAEARKRIARKYNLSFSRVKSVHLEYTRVDREAHKDLPD